MDDNTLTSAHRTAGMSVEDSGEVAETPPSADESEDAASSPAPAASENAPAPADHAAEDEDSTTDGAEPHETDSPEPDPIARDDMDWYVLRVASNKEEQVCKALERKVKIEGLETRIGRILVPTVRERRIKGGQARVFQRKLYPGYVFVEMTTEQDGAIPEDIWFLVKETTGVGDFIGSDGKPIKMGDHDVTAMLAVALKSDEQVELSDMNLRKGDLAKVTEGSFESFEGTVDSVDENRGMVTVLLTIFGRSTPVEVEYWQLEKI